MKFPLLLLLLLLPFAALAGEWQAFTYTENYSRACRLGDNLYILKGNSLVRASVSGWAIEKELTREDGLSSTRIVDICYSEEANRMAVVYADGLIDVFHPDGSIWTIPDFYNAPMQGTDKTINGIRQQEGYSTAGRASVYLYCFRVPRREPLGGDHRADVQSWLAGAMCMVLQW